MRGEDGRRGLVRGNQHAGDCVKHTSGIADIDCVICF